MKLLDAIRNENETIEKLTYMTCILFKYISSYNCTRTTTFSRIIQKNIRKNNVCSMWWIIYVLLWVHTIVNYFVCSFNFKIPMIRRNRKMSSLTIYFRRVCFECYIFNGEKQWRKSPDCVSDSRGRNISTTLYAENPCNRAFLGDFCSSPWTKVEYITNKSCRTDSPVLYPVFALSLPTANILLMYCIWLIPF